MRGSRDIGIGNHALVDHAGEHMIAAAFGGDGMAIRPLAFGRLRQRHQQGRLGKRERFWLLAEIGEARGAHPFEIAAERGEGEIEVENLGLAEAPLQFDRAHRLPELGRERAFLARFEQARHLHGEGGSPRNDMAGLGKLDRSARQRQRIDAGMAVKTLVLIGFEQGKIARRNIGHACFQPPIAIAREKRAQQCAMTIHHFGRERGRARHVRREQAVGDQQHAHHAERGQNTHTFAARETAPLHCAITTLPMAVRAWTAGAYISSAIAAGRTKLPGVTARAI